MADNEVKIGDRSLNENMEVRTNVKTLLWVAIGLFSALITIFTIFYFDMRSRDEATNDRMDTVVKTLKTDVSKTLKEELRIYEERQLQIKDDIGDIRGDIKVILDRTSSHKEATYTIDDTNVPGASSPPTDALPHGQ